MSSTRSTLQLFDRHIKKKENGELDATGIVGKECYQEWLESRTQPPKSPHEAFRKTITAHCRGDNGMQPFSEEKEAAVLAVIRQKKVWDCFQGSGQRVGLRGFQTLGYWERKRQQKRGQNSSQELVSKIKNENGVIERENGDIQFYDCNLFVHNEKLYGRLKKEDFVLPNLKEINNDKALTDQDYQKVKEAVNSILTSVPTSAFKAGLEAMFSTAKDLTFVFLLQIFRQAGFQVFLPKSLPNLKEMDENLKHFYSEEFAFPKQDERSFLRDRIVGVMVCDPATLSAYQVDDYCRKIFRGCIVGVSAVNMKVNKVQACSFAPKILNTMTTEKEIWTRTVEFRLDGTVMVLLSHVFKTVSAPMGVVIKHQDITDKYENMLREKVDLKQ